MNIATGIYEHYKSTPENRKLYLLLGKGKHTETGESLAIYIPLYQPSAGDSPAFMARPLDMFFGEVAPGQPRFRWVGSDVPKAP